MSETKPIPVRLDHEVIQRLDRAAERLGNTRAGVIKLCLTAFLDHFEEAGMASLPLNWREIAAFWDRRTRRSRGSEPRASFPGTADSVHILNESPDSKAPAAPTAPAAVTATPKARRKSK